MSSSDDRRTAETLKAIARQMDGGGERTALDQAKYAIKRLTTEEKAELRRWLDEDAS